MKRIAFYLCVAALFFVFSSAAQAQCPPRTTVADTIYNADGSLAAGRVLIAWPTFTIGACQVVAGQASVNVVNGAFSADLYPNTAALPAGTSYRVTYYLKSGKITTEYWVVPASGSPVSIASVRSASVPVPTVMFSQSQVTNLLTDLAKKIELPSPCPPGKFLQSNGSPTQPQVNCVDGTGGSGGGSQHQVNAANLLSNDPVNFQSTATIAFSNPSAGSVQAAVPDSSITAAKLNVSSPSAAQLSGVADANIAAGALSPNRIAGTAEVQSNKGAAIGYASLDGTAKVPAAQLPDATTTAKGAVELATSGESAANLAVQANDVRLSDARSPTAHAATHQHGGSDPVATATPGANAIPKADGSGKLADGWLSANVSLLGSTIGLTSEVAGVLPEANGGTNQSTYAAGDLLYASAANTLAKLPIGAANRVLLSDGSAPSWSTVPDTALASNYSGVGACTNQFARALNDNAAPTCASVSLTSDVSGSLPVANGGTGAASATAARSNLGVYYGMSVGAGAGANPADNATYYTGWNTFDGFSGDNFNHYAVVPVAGTVKRFCAMVYVAGTQGSGESVTLTLRKNKSADAAQTISQTWNAAEVGPTCVNVTTAFTVAQDDYLTVKISAPAWATNPTNVRVRWSVQILQDQ